MTATDFLVAVLLAAAGGIWILRVEKWLNPLSPRAKNVIAVLIFLAAIGVAFLGHKEVPVLGSQRMLSLIATTLAVFFLVYFRIATCATPSSPACSAAAVR